jgi:hypothetical protein
VPVHQGAGFAVSQAPVKVGFWSGSIVRSAMVVTRVAVTAFRAVRATEGTPWAERRAAVGLRPRHTHLHHHAY